MKKTTRKVIAKSTPTFRSRLMALAVSSCFSGAVYALGVNPNVVAGSATISQSGNVMTVSNSNGTIINWGALSVQKGEALIFNQARTSSILNRVIGMNVNGKWITDPSIIAGTLSSPGSVYWINPGGAMVMNGAKIDVYRLVLSTVDISNANFLAGMLLFDGPAGPGSVVVEEGATIKTASGGSVYLIGSSVTNNGVIITPEGETILAAGESVSIVDTGTPGVRVEITRKAGKVTNLGTILAEAGRIGMAGALVRNSGTLNASSVVKEGGRIFLKASQDAYVDGDGRIVTTGTKGGRVEVLGNRVAVMDNASIDASGANGGGTVLVGGDYQGKNADVQNSTITYFGKNAAIKADATDKGNGGKVIVWADEATKAEGRIFARGGAQGGNGGFAEVSGKRYLDYRAMADLTAVKGFTGKLLLDPMDISIVGTGSTSGAPFTGTGVWGFEATGTGSSLGWDTIESQLSNANVYVTAGNISIDSNPSNSGHYNSANSLNLLATGNINAAGRTVINDGNGAINLYAGWDNSSWSLSNPSNIAITPATGSITIDGSTIQTGGSMTWKAGSSITVQGSVVYGGAFVKAASQNFEVTDTTNGSIVVQGANRDGASAVIESSGDQSLTAHRIRVLGGYTDSTTGLLDASAAIRANGTQQLTLTGSNARLELKGGGFTGPSANNSARIEQTKTGGSQTITFTSTGGTIFLTGGYDDGSDGAGNNGAKIDGGMGSQTIGSSSVRPDIVLYGGASGGSLNHGNEASIGLRDENSGTQTVYAGNINIVGGDAVYGGAGFSGRVQRFDLTGNLAMTGGSSSQLDTSDNTPGGIAYIGNKNGADIQLHVTGNVTLQGGAGSPVMIGSLSNSANVQIASGADVSITSYNGGGSVPYYGGVFIGSRQALAPGASDLSSNNVLLGANTSITAAGNVDITSYGGNVALGHVVAGSSSTASITAYGAILDSNGSAMNVEAQTVNLTSQYGGAASGLAISADTVTSGTLTATVNGTATYGGISLRNVSASGPGTINLSDSSSDTHSKVSFYNSGDLDLFSVNTLQGHAIAFSAGKSITGGEGAISAVDASGTAVPLSLQAGSSIELGMFNLSGSSVDLRAGSISLTNSTVKGTSGDLNLKATTVSVENSNLLAYANLFIDAGSIFSSGSFLAAGYSSPLTNGEVPLGGGRGSPSVSGIANVDGNVTMTAATGDIVLNDGTTVAAGNDVTFNLNGSASKLYLNDTAGLATVKVISDIATQVPATTHLNFLLNPSGGVVIDGANTTTTTAGGSGFYVLNSSTPASAGYGLAIVYNAAGATTGDAAEASKTTTTTLNRTTTDDNLTDETSSNNTLILKTVASNSSQSGTAGGEDGTFGSEDKKEKNGDTTQSGDKKEQSNGKSTSKNQCS
ncbi:MAG TPA: filamentous hemagglutinin N-terminal domain-containing protein [Rhodocyclaceae bacterium]|nr:filamentous hemagglutinin N-terminal domain-containing protein [Rhodocyclaceae bacterium]